MAVSRAKGNVYVVTLQQVGDSLSEVGEAGGSQKLILRRINREVQNMSYIFIVNINK